MTPGKVKFLAVKIPAVCSVALECQHNFLKYCCKGGVMKEFENGNAGIRQMVSMYRKMFRIRENLDFYSEKDFIAAERKFLKYVLLHGDFRSQTVFRQGAS